MFKLSRSIQTESHIQQKNCVTKFHFEPRTLCSFTLRVGAAILRGRCLPQFPGGASVNITDKISVLWTVSLMLALSCSLLGREYTLINVLKALTLIISICNLHVIRFSQISPRYFTWFTKGMFRPFNVRWPSGGLSLWENLLQLRRWSHRKHRLQHFL
jgi:hypothetical protein